MSGRGKRAVAWLAVVGAAWPAAVAAAPTGEVPPPAPSPSSATPAQARHPGTGLRLRAGYAGGGEPVISVSTGPGNRQSLDAGQGWVVAAAAIITPFWTAEGIGFGAGVEIGWKGDDIRPGGDALAFRRAPLLAFIQMLIPVAVEPRLHLVVAGGVCKDLAAHVTGSFLGEAISLDFTSRFGAIAEAGAAYRWAPSLSFGLTARYTAVTYSGNGENHIDGTSFGLALGAQYDL